MSTTSLVNHSPCASTPTRHPWLLDDSNDSAGTDAPVDFLDSSTSEAVAVLHKKWDTLSAARRKEILRDVPPFVICNYEKAIERLVVDNVEERQALRVARGMQSFVECADLLSSVSSALDCVVPGASAIFRLMKSIFVASKALVEIQDYLVELFIDRISSNLGLVDKYRQLFPSNPDLLSSVLDIYAVVLEIGTRAARIFYDDKGIKRSGLRLFVSAAWSSSKNDLEALCRKFVVRLDTFDRAARLALSQATSSGLETVVSAQIRHETQLRHLEADLSHHSGLLMDEKSQRDTGLEATKAKERLELLRWIGQETAKLDCAAIHDKLRRAAVNGTGQWLLKQSTFEYWLNQQGPAGLWITGKWGTGKSVLASTVIHSFLERSQQEDESVCAYLYCSSEYPFLSSSAVTGVKSGKGISYKAILGSLLCQIYGGLPQDRNIDSMVHCWRQGIALLETHLEQAIMHAISVLKRAFIVIDGLDELQRIDEADFRAFCRFIGSLNQTSSRGSVLVFSRPDYPDISSAMEGHAVVKIDDRHNSADISVFVDQQVSSLSRMGRYEQQMKNNLIRRANGVFRWVSAVVHYIRHLKTPRARAEAVNNMPPGLKDVYAKILERILQQSHTNSNYAVMALIWATHAFRPLYSEEMVEALSVEPGMTQIDEDDRIDVDKLCEDCYGLLELSDGVYQLSHDSVREFLLKTPVSDYSGLVDFWKLRDTAHERLAEICLTYLTFDVFDIERTEFSHDCVVEPLHESYPFLRYASHRWGDHVREASVDPPVSLEAVVHSFLLSDNHREVAIQVVQEDSGEERLTQAADGDSVPSCGFTLPLHFVALFNLVSLLPVYGCEQAAFLHKDSFGFLPIDYAVQRSRKQAFDRIVDLFSPGPKTEAMAKTSRYCLPHAVARRDWADSLRKLLDLGFDADGRKGRQSLLDAAAASGSVNSVRVLLDAGADMENGSGFGYTPLVTAAHGRKSKVCKVLIEQGANINARIRSGQTVLHALAEYDEDLVKELVDRHVEVVAAYNESTALHVAAMYGQVEIIRILCCYLAGSNKLRSELARGLTMRHHPSFNVIQTAIVEGHGDVARCLIEEYEENPLQVKQPEGYTLLHLAARSGVEDIIDYLLGPCGVDPNAKDRSGGTALHVAALEGKFAFARRLLEACPSLNRVQQDNLGRVPLHFAALNGNAKGIDLLLDHGSQVDDKYGWLPFHYAVSSGNLQCIHLLLREGIVNKPTPHSGLTALDIAAQYRRYTVVGYLARKVGQSEEFQTACARTPLHLAAKAGQAQVVSELLVAGYDPLSQDEEGATPLMLALQFSPSQLSVALQLLGPNMEALRLSTKAGRTCVDFVAAFGGPELWNALWPDRYVQSARLHPVGLNPVYHAAWGGNSHMVELLAAAGFNINEPNIFGTTPLMIASASRRFVVVAKLLDLGADVHRTDQLGRTALHWAVIKRATRVTGKLLEAGSDVTEKDSLGLSAADYAKFTRTLSRIVASYCHDEPIRCSIEATCLFIARTSQELLSNPYKDGQGLLTQDTRLVLMEALAFALVKLGRMSEAIPVMRALMSHPSRCCSACACALGRENLRRLGFACLVCHGIIICQDCYERYKDARYPPHRSDCQRRLELLESKVRLVGRSLYALGRFNAYSVRRLLCSSYVFEYWIESIRDEYVTVENDWRSSAMLVDMDNLTGLDLGKTLREVLRATGSEEEGYSDMMSNLTSELCDPTVVRSLETECVEFSCHGHPFLAVVQSQQSLDTEENLVIEDGQLTPYFYTQLAATYSSPGQAFPELVVRGVTTDMALNNHASTKDTRCEESDPEGNGNREEDYSSDEKIPDQPILNQSDDSKKSDTSSEASATSSEDASNPDLADEVARAEHIIEQLDKQVNPFTNRREWKVPFHEGRPQTLRDAMWQVTKAIIATHDDPVELIVEHGWDLHVKTT